MASKGRGRGAFLADRGRGLGAGASVVNNTDAAATVAQAATGAAREKRSRAVLKAREQARGGGQCKM